MSRQALTQTAQIDGQERMAANTIRQSIAHFFGDNSDDTMIARITDHTFRDIGVDRTVYEYL